MSISNFKRLASFFYPILIENKVDFFGKNHRMELYCNQYMLSTSNAIYSYGTKYYPFRKPFEKIKTDLQHVDSFLMLGTGLGSGLKILQDKFGHYPTTTLVDFNQTILDLSKQYMNLNSRQNVTWICDDAQHFILNCDKKFDMIGIDIFVDMSVPLFVKSASFMQKMHSLLNRNGHAIFNLLFASSNEEVIIKDRLNQTFSEVIHIKHDRNHFFICKY
jgi:ubiquinone/menaquinone biosynthesis C-methylase UbiE